MEAFRNIVVRQSCRIEPFFQGFRLPGMSEGVAKPHPTQRRHFVETCPASCRHRERRIGPYRVIQDVFAVEKIIGNLEAQRWRELLLV